MATHTTETGERSALPRKPLSAILHKGRWNRVLAFLTYAPLVGFAVFFIDALCGALGRSGVIPTYAAVWAPPALALLSGLSLLCYTEDG